MFNVIALVCNLTGNYPNTSEGCTIFTSNAQFDNEAQCVEYLTTRGVIDLYNVLLLNGEIEPQLKAAKCEPMGEPV